MRACNAPSLPCTQCDVDLLGTPAELIAGPRGAHTKAAQSAGKALLPAAASRASASLADSSSPDSRPVPASRSVAHAATRPGPGPPSALHAVQGHIANIMGLQEVGAGCGEASRIL